MILLERRVRGFRLVDLIAAGLLVVLVLGVYLAKTMAGRERAEIARIDRQIDEEHSRIRLLQAEVAHLEEPARLERLSETYLHLAPTPIRRDVEPEALADLVRASLVATRPTPAPAPAETPPASFDPTRPAAAEAPPSPEVPAQ